MRPLAPLEVVTRSDAHQRWGLGDDKHPHRRLDGEDVCEGEHPFIADANRRLMPHAEER
jgi:hypothetical protein